VIDAFKAPESEGKGAIALQGAMIERLHLEGAMRIMAIADAPGHGAT
jgi:citrate lyase subunit beta/citryl-CoA lyase